MPISVLHNLLRKILLQLCHCYLCMKLFVILFQYLPAAYLVDLLIYPVGWRDSAERRS
jgi:hypothetical protein